MRSPDPPDDEPSNAQIARAEERLRGEDPEPDDRYRDPNRDPLQFAAPKPYPGGELM